MGRLPAETGMRQIAIDPNQPKRVYATDETRVYRSDDAGQTWQPAGSGLPEDQLTALTLDPRQPERLYITTAAGTVYTSQDGAESWQVVAQTGTDEGA